MIHVGVTSGGRVDCHATVRIPLSASMVWGQLRDFDKFARQEFFHANVVVEGNVPKHGVKIRLAHRFFLFRTNRVGRICSWKEGVGFSFSDLRAGDARGGFPHVFGYQIESISTDACNLHIRVSGKWTAPLVPRALAWLWLRWIMQFTTQNVRNEFLMYQLWLASVKRREKRR